MRRDRSKSPKPSFRNTRSKFFKKKNLNQTHEQKTVHEESTGDYWKAKGNEALGKGQLDQAIKHYTKAIEMNPGGSVYFSNRAKCYKMQRKFEQALKDAEEACELEENNIKAHYICGCVLAELGKREEKRLSKAENRLKKALRLCQTLKQQQFIDTISIKLYRLRKLKWMVEQKKKEDFLRLQGRMIESSLHEGIIDRETYETMKGQAQSMHWQKPKEVPDYMLCKITLEIMEEPVTTEEGMTYEKSAIEDHFQTNGYTEPISRQPLKGKVYPNVSLKNAIQAFLDENPWAYEFSEGELYEDIQF